MERSDHGTKWPDSELRHPSAWKVTCVASVSVQFSSKEQGTRVKDRAKNGASLALVSFLARPKPRIPFLGLSLLRNQMETLATQATWKEPLISRKSIAFSHAYIHSFPSTSNSCHKTELKTTGRQGTNTFGVRFRVPVSQKHLSPFSLSFLKKLPNEFS